MSTVPMFSPDGRLGDIPAEHVADAAKAGFKMGVPLSSPDGKNGVVPVDRAHEAMKAGFQPTMPQNELQQRMATPESEAKPDDVVKHGGAGFTDAIGALVGPIIDFLGMDKTGKPSEDHKRLAAVAKVLEDNPKLAIAAHAGMRSMTASSQDATAPAKQETPPSQ